MEALKKQILLDALPPSRPAPSRTSAHPPRTSSPPRASSSISSSSSSTAAGRPLQRTFNSPSGGLRRDQQQQKQRAPSSKRAEVVELSSDSSDDDDSGGGSRPRAGGRDARLGGSSDDSENEVRVVSKPSARPQHVVPTTARTTAPTTKSIFTQRPAPKFPFAPRAPSSSASAASSSSRAVSPAVSAAQQPPAGKPSPAQSSITVTSRESTPSIVPTSASSSAAPNTSGSQARTGVHAPFKPPRFTTPPAFPSSSSSSPTYAQKASSTSSSSANARSQQTRPDVSLTPNNPFGVSRALNVHRPAFLPSNLDFGRSGSSSSAKPKKAPSEDLPKGANEGESFDLGQMRLESDDYDRVPASEADRHMRELLEGVSNDFVGNGGEGGEGFAEGEDVVEGFKSGIRLMPHQILGTKWMKSRETGRRTGGILGDDMGLGKTVQSLVRIVSGPPRKSEVKAGWTGGTLIVCPLAVMSQWKQEVLGKTTKGLLSVCEHQGGDRTTLTDDLLDYDVVITTYNVVQQEHTNHLAALAAGERKKGKQKAGAGSSASDSDDSSDSDESFGASLGKKKAGANKTKKKASPPTGKGAARKALFAVRWHRIILDEAQNIKNRNSKTAKACIALESKYRWCLTGTPIQNNVEELYPLFAFLRIRPLNDWDYFKSTIAKPVKEGRTKLAMKKLQLVLGSIMLRRLKTAEVNGKKILNLPARTVTVVKCLFDEDEWTFYRALAERTALRMSKFMRSGSVSSNYTSILTMLLRLRQACDHPELVSQSFGSDPDAIAPQPSQHGAAVEEDADADELAALLGGLSVGKRATCSVCSEDLAPGSKALVCSDRCAEVQAMAERAKEEVAGLPPTSAKTRKILELLENVRVSSGGTEKTIIFSQFTKMLDKIEPFLRHAGHKFVRYDGSLKNEDRTKVLDRFRASATTNVILISFKAGSTGLNLTAANHVILVDLWWNPALEEQAFDRAHRLGQTRDVEIYKLAIEETVEDKILALQEKKRELASAALSGTKLNVGKGGNRLGVDELMMLFKGIVSPHDDPEDD